METCKLLHENVFAYVEKDLPPVMLQQFDKHVAECAECAAMVADFKSVLILMEEQKSIEPRPFAETRILQGIESRLEKRQSSSFPVFGRILQPALISVGVATALSIGFFIGSDFANVNSQYSQNEEITESVRSDLNVPEFMTDDIIYFTE
ncbi:MAG: zf-HC2 domain-containing protein [Bacteroidales bacterium]|nr:zf-HC2 domain-containing protein [Bacteroidales bacterium]